MKGEAVACFLPYGGGGTCSDSIECGAVLSGVGADLLGSYPGLLLLLKPLIRTDLVAYFFSYLKQLEPKSNHQFFIKEKITLYSSILGDRSSEIPKPHLKTFWSSCAQPLNASGMPININAMSNGQHERRSLLFLSMASGRTGCR